MRSTWKYACLIVLAFVICVPVTAQDKEEKPVEQSDILDRSMVTIRSIRVKGNKITKKYIVLREVRFDTGKAYSLSDILSRLKTSRNNLMNTSLFVDVGVDFTSWFNDSMDIVVDVKERWYYYPVPHFKPVDRNWNVWINQNNVSFDRVDYGLKFLGNNVTGRNDKVTVWLVNGYTRQIAVSYHNPYLDKKLKHGAGFDFSYAKNREINYTTRQNQQVFYKDQSTFIRERLYAGLSYSYRPGSINRHSVKIGFVVDNLADTIRSLNPKFFGKGATQNRYTEIRYRYQHLDVDYIPYPSKGHTIDFIFTNRGLIGDMNMTQFNVKVARHWPLPHKFYYSLGGEANLKLPFEQPFYNLPMLGYGDSYLRGLEYYVIDGVAGGLIRNTLRKEIASVKLKTGLKSRTYGSIPFKFFLKAYGDVGYVYDKNNYTGNFLTNRFMYTGGFGLDILTIYDFVFRFEYSFNQLNEHAFFFHKNDF